MDVTQKRAEVGRSAVESADNFLRSHFRNGSEIHQKAGHEITIAEDRAAEKIIIDAIRTQFPADTILSEEVGEIQGSSEYSWIIDPLDGTTNYSSELAFFDVQLALMHHASAIFSVVSAPLLGETFTASLGRGACCNDRSLQIRAESDLIRATICIGKGSLTKHHLWWGRTCQKLATRTRSLRLFGATGLELALVAAGSYAAHINYGSKVMDYVPGALLIREAGGVVKTFSGADWQPGDPDLIAGSSAIVEQLVPLLQASLTEDVR